MAQQPSRRDIWRPPPQAGDVRPTVRHLGQAQRSMDPGYLGGRWATPKPVPGGPSQIVGGEGDGGDDESSVIGEDGDRLVLTSLATQAWALSYIPISETLHVFFHPAGGSGIRWLRGTDYEIDEDSNVVTVTAATLAAAQAHLGEGDFLSAQYLRIEGEQDATAELDSLVPRGWVLSTLPGDVVDLPDGTEIGDLIVVGNAVMRSDGAPGLVVPVDSRLEQVSHNTWVGYATHLGSIEFHDYGADDRFCGVVTTWADPAHYQSNSAAGPGGPGLSPMASPTVASHAAILVASTDNSNGHGTINDVPADWVNLVPEQIGTVSSVQVWYWVDPAAPSSPAGDIEYDVHADPGGGKAYATVLAIGGE